jgi:membrane protease YdiL (CAAX protease family)
MNVILWGLFSLLPVFAVPVMLVLFRDSSVWPAVIVYHALCWIVPLVSRLSLKAAGFGPGEPQQWIRRTLFLALILLTAGETVHFLIATQRLRPFWEHVLPLMQPWRLYVVYSLLLNPASEEFYWRGFLLKRMSPLRNAWLFWLMHAAVAMVFDEPLRAIWFTLPAFAFGLVCALMRRQYGTLWPCILIHLAADIAILRGAAV